MQRFGNETRRSIGLAQLEGRIPDKAFDKLKQRFGGEGTGSLHVHRPRGPRSSHMPSPIGNGWPRH